MSSKKIHPTQRMRMKNRVSYAKGSTFSKKANMAVDWEHFNTEGKSDVMKWKSK